MGTGAPFDKLRAGSRLSAERSEAVSEILGKFTISSEVVSKFRKSLSFRASRSECAGDTRNLLFSFRQLMTATNRNAPSHRLTFRQLPDLYAIVRLSPDASVPHWATQADFSSITRTPEELSIVCPLNNVPKDVSPGPRWICLKLEGPFPFSQTGVLLSFIAPLSDNGVSIFAVSTYDTDYVLIQKDFIGHALDMLQRAGHELWPSDESRRRFIE